MTWVCGEAWGRGHSDKSSQRLGLSRDHCLLDCNLGRLPGGGAGTDTSLMEMREFCGRDLKAAMLIKCCLLGSAAPVPTSTPLPSTELGQAEGTAFPGVSASHRRLTPAPAMA